MSNKKFIFLKQRPTVDDGADYGVLQYSGHLVVYHETNDEFMHEHGNKITFFEDISVIQNIFSPLDPYFNNNLGNITKKFNIKSYNFELKDYKDLQVVPCAELIFVLLHPEAEEWGIYFDLDFTQADKLENYL